MATEVIGSQQPKTKFLNQLNNELGDQDDSCGTLHSATVGSASVADPGGISTRGATKLGAQQQFRR
jgi:hypothetical protein